MSRSKKLFQLQKIDTAIEDALERISEIDHLLKQDEELKAAQKAEKAAKRQLEEKRKVLKLAERDVKDQERKIEENESKLYGGKVTNPKELEDLQRESDALHRYLETLEERQLEAMLEVDRAEKKHNQARRSLEGIEENRKSLHKELSGEKSDLEEEIENLHQQRGELIEGIKDDDIEHYERLRDSLAGIAVAQVNNESCSACGTQVPSATCQKARSLSQITHCKTCNRILHAE